MKQKLIVKNLLSTLFFFMILFLSAGTFRFLQAWIYVIIGLLMFLLTNTRYKIDEDLMIERSKPSANTKKWDKLILILSLITTIIMFIVAGLDSGRNHWSPDFNYLLIIVGAILTFSGQLIFIVAQKQNKFFSSTVRIQTERNHIVCSSGLYKFVRHPAYFGSIVQSIGFPMLFNSLWSLFPVCFLIILLIVRTFLEDKTLVEELIGYSEYTQKTRFKIIPYIW